NGFSRAFTSLPLARDLRLWAHRRSARPKGLDRAPGPSRAHAPAARASSPLGDFARRDPDCCRVGAARRLWRFAQRGGERGAARVGVVGGLWAAIQEIVRVTVSKVPVIRSPAIVPTRCPFP